MSQHETIDETQAIRGVLLRIASQLDLVVEDGA
jgi:hypothetical protein